MKIDNVKSSLTSTLNFIVKQISFNKIVLVFDTSRNKTV